MRNYPYYKFNTSLSYEGRKQQLQFLSASEINIIEDFYMNNDGTFEGEFIYFDYIEKITKLPS